jgi:DNA-binding MarR family transcriptional regulator
MPLLMSKDMPQHERLIEAARIFPELEPLSYMAFLHLLRAGDDTLRVSDAHLQRQGISQGRFAVMMHLLKSEGDGRGSFARTPAELASLASVSRATITGLVDSLERDGLVVRTPDTRDRRMLFVSLTRKGRDFAWRILPEHFQRVVSLMEVLAETERRTLVRLLLKISTRANVVEPSLHGGDL